MAVNKANSEALLAAMGRVLDGTATKTDGSFTWNAVCVEAEVPRATAARAKDIIAKWKEAVASRELVPGPMENGGATPAQPVLEGGGTEQVGDAETIRELRATVRAMANHIQALTLALKAKDAALAENNASAKVSPIRNR